MQDSMNIKLLCTLQERMDISAQKNDTKFILLKTLFVKLIHLYQLEMGY